MKLSRNVYFFEGRNSVVIEGNVHIIEKKQSDLLSFFLKNKNVVFSKEDILNNVWDSIVSEQVVTQAIFKLRKLFKDNNIESPIITVPQKGYLYDETVFNDKKNYSIQRLVNKKNIIIFLLCIPIIFYAIKRNMEYDVESCSVINCNNLVFLDFPPLNSRNNGVLRLIKWHFKVNHNVNISSSSVIKKLSYRRLRFDSNKNEIRFYDSRLKGSGFSINYNRSLNKNDFISLMKKLEEKILLEYEHHDLDVIYSDLPNNSESFDLLLSSIGETKYSLFSDINIKKLDLAREIDEDNEYIISLRYIFKLFNIYDKYSGGEKLNQNIDILNDSFISDVKKLSHDDYSLKLFEALAAYEITKGNAYKSLEYLDKLGSKEDTVLGLFLRAKTEKMLNKEDISNEKLLKISENLGEKNFEIMMKFFNYN